MRVLEIGSGGAQGARWVAGAGRGAPWSPPTCRPACSTGPAGSTRRSPTRGSGVPLVQCDGAALPFPDEAFDVVFTAYGVVPFVADSGRVMAEAARVLRSGRPVRLLDDPPRPVGDARRPGRAGPARDPVVLRPHRVRRAGRRRRRRPTSSTTGPSATGSARSPRPAYGSSTSSSRSGRRRTSRPGPAGRSCAAGWFPGTAIFVCRRDWRGSGSDQRVAAVDDDRLAHDVAGRVRGEEHDEPAQVRPARRAGRPAPEPASPRRSPGSRR